MAIVRCIVYSHKHTHQTPVAQSEVALKIQPQCARIVEAPAWLISRLISDQLQGAGCSECSSAGWFAFAHGGTRAECRVEHATCDMGRQRAIGCIFIFGVFWLLIVVRVWCMATEISSSQWVGVLNRALELELGAGSWEFEW